MSVFEALKKANPDLPLYTVTDPEFEAYGRILPLPEAEEEELFEALSRTPLPEEGNAYFASLPQLETARAVRRFERSVFGCMGTEAGCCNGRGFTLNALEYHKCPEVNYSTDGLVLLLALPEQLRDGFPDSREVKGFYLPPHMAVEIFPRVLHFAPCRVSPDGFRCLVVLEKGVNEALPVVNPSAPGEEKLLWMRGKWMTCHPDSPQTAKGAFAGIRGRNLTLQPVPADKSAAHSQLTV